MPLKDQQNANLAQVGSIHPMIYPHAIIVMQVITLSKDHLSVHYAKLELIL